MPISITNPKLSDLAFAAEVISGDETLSWIGSPDLVAFAIGNTKWIFGIFGVALLFIVSFGGNSKHLWSIIITIMLMIATFAPIAFAAFYFVGRKMCYIITSKRLLFVYTNGNFERNYRAGKPISIGALGYKAYGFQTLWYLRICLLRNGSATIFFKPTSQFFPLDVQFVIEEKALGAWYSPRFWRKSRIVKDVTWTGFGFFNTPFSAFFGVSPALGLADTLFESAVQFRGEDSGFSARLNALRG